MKFDKDMELLSDRVSEVEISKEELDEMMKDLDVDN